MNIKEKQSNNDNESYSLFHIAKYRLPVGGKHRDYEALSKFVNTYNITPDKEEVSKKRLVKYFKLQTLNDAWQLYAPRDRVNMDDLDDEYSEIKKETAREVLSGLKKRNKLAEKEIEKRDIQIEQLKMRLVDYEEATKYLLARKAIHAALIRRIIISSIPPDICGLEIAAARDKCEEYYNEIMEAELETSNLWTRKYLSNKNDINKLEKEIEDDIRRIINGTTDKDNNADISTAN